jgi:CubicO group peptidase (beta-lactamase class C family)
MKRILICVAAAVISFGAAAEGLKTARPEDCGMDAARLSRVDSVINDEIANKTIPGAVISVVRGDKIVYLKAYGNKSVVPKVEPMTTETMFDLASLSKCVGTTLSFMQLIEKGYVRLTDNVSRYIPGFKPWKDPETGETVDITIRDLMTHSSGLSPYLDVNEYIKEFGENTPDSAEAYIATRVKRNFRPGTEFMYSCLNFITLQRILERVTGQKLYEYAAENVFGVLGLQHTCYFPLDVIASAKGEQARRYKELKALCAPTEVQPDGKPLLAQVHDPIARRIMTGNSGNAGVFSNAEDLSVICAAIMNHGSLNGHRILSPMTVDLMTTIPPQNSPDVGRALGWDKKSSHSGPRGDIFDAETTIEHTGYTGTSIVIDMKTRTSVILLTHRVHPKDEGSVGRMRALISNIVAASIMDPAPQER